jgi:hypothetical protein
MCSVCRDGVSKSFVYSSRSTSNKSNFQLEFFLIFKAKEIAEGLAVSVTGTFIAMS